MFKNTITKEELALLPKENFTGNITIIDSLQGLDSAIELLEQEEVIGFDTETKPCFTKGNGGNMVALMQLSTQTECFLFRLNKIGTLPNPLARLMANPNIKKIGISLKDDFHALNRRKRSNFKPSAFVDLQSVIANYGIEEMSLQKIYAIVFGKRISKSQQLSNWEAETLSEAQKEYAALDAWACLQIFKELSKHQPQPIQYKKSLPKAQPNQ
jgi:ribonuclease D